MPTPTERKRIHLNAPPEYEMKLLTALAAFLGRKVSTQASAALSMYLRQSHDRILSQAEYYGNKWGMTKWEVLDLCYENPAKAKELMDASGTVHSVEDGPDAFSETGE